MLRFLSLCALSLILCWSTMAIGQETKKSGAKPSLKDLSAARNAAIKALGDFADPAKEGSLAKKIADLRIDLDKKNYLQGGKRKAAMKEHNEAVAAYNSTIQGLKAAVLDATENYNRAMAAFNSNVAEHNKSVKNYNDDVKKFNNSK